MSRIPHLDRAAWHTRMAGYNSPCYAMYSSIAGGIVTDADLMVVPVHDHVVHRGDGVFETLKCVEGGIYNLAAHLDRLEQSAEGIGLVPPCSREDCLDIVLETARAAGKSDMALRIMWTRGPGGMGVAPHECPQSAYYVVAYPAARPFMQRNPEGARIGWSTIPPKPPPFAALKHCNYLPNALMAREAKERGLDFVIAVGPDDRVLEGPTENIAFVSEDGRLLTPAPPDVLPGTTLARVLELAEPLVASGALKDVASCLVSRSQANQARECFILGTSHDIVAVREREGKPLRHGPEGPVYKALSAALQNDILHNTTLRTMI